MQSLFFLHSHLLPNLEYNPYLNDINIRGTVWCVELNKEICLRQKMPYRIPNGLRNQLHQECIWLLSNIESVLPTKLKITRESKDFEEDYSDKNMLMVLAPNSPATESLKRFLMINTNSLRDTKWTQASALLEDRDIFDVMRYLPKRFV